MNNDKVVDDIKILYDRVLAEPSFLIYQQQMLINEAKREIHMMELYEKTNISFINDPQKKASCQRAIVNAKNQITLRENYVEYLKTLEKEDLKKENELALKTDPLYFYKDRLEFRNETIKEPAIITVDEY